MYPFNARILQSIESIAHDVGYAIRSLRRQPGFTTVAVFVLAAVTGLNTSLFTIVSALSFHPPKGINDPGRVVSLYPTVPFGEPEFFSVAEYRFLADHATTITPAAIAGGGLVPLGRAGASGTAAAFLVSGNFFTTLGIAMNRGRPIEADDDRIGAPETVVVLGSRLWESRFGGDPGIVGRSLLLNDVPFTVIGIASKEFVGLEPAMEPSPALYMPVAAFPRLRPELQRKSESAGSTSIVGRLAAGATREQARAEADLLLRNFDAVSGITARPVLATSTAFLSHPGRSIILALFGLISLALMLVWLMGCANVGNLQLARAAARTHEIGIRLSLGASRSRIVRQLLTEGFVLALVACGLGVGIAFALPTLLIRTFGDAAAVDALNFSLAPDTTVLVSAILLAAASAVAFALAPALHVTRHDVMNALRDRDGLPASRFPLRSVFLALQVAVSVIVLVGAGLLLRRVQRQATFDPGLPVDEISVVTFAVSGDAYVDAARTKAFVTDLTAALRPLPIGRFAFTTHEPFSPGGNPTTFRRPGESQQAARPITYTNVTPGYMEVLHVPVIAGRDFEDADATRAVVLINESMARQFWPDESPVGKTFITAQGQSHEIIGVVRNVSDGLDAVLPRFYRPLTSGASGAFEMEGGRRVAVTDGGPIPQLVVGATQAAALDEIGRIVARIDARVHAVTKPLSATLEERRRVLRIGPLLASILGLFALTLASVGVFGAFAYAVRQRTREIGIRMALGARHIDVVRLILSGHARAVIGGLSVGFVGSLAAARMIRRFAFGVTAFDPVAYLGVAAILALAGLAASYVPARRATKIDPMVALRRD